ncbi:putative 26S proteasome non-ATPase regulatory subunit 3 [Iris pallida]|uniref:26S proteasome non-ATPase regulatory subunit 3 n=1 Tax=Iris pallida TaxID=29817 RepID=A0AAX6DTU2_IRIPA|nr:putative 26S proteasome non-ATPase regulatory subunit 3 [Iris pallida]
MTQDLEMKDAQLLSDPVPSVASSILQNLKEIASLIETDAYGKEVRRIVRAVRLTILHRRKLTAPVVAAFLGFALGQSSEAHSKLSSYYATSEVHVPAASKHAVPELEIYCYLLVLIFLIGLSPLRPCRVPRRFLGPLPVRRPRRVRAQSSAASRPCSASSASEPPLRAGRGITTIERYLDPMGLLVSPAKDLRQSAIGSVAAAAEQAFLSYAEKVLER